MCGLQTKQRAVVATSLSSIRSRKGAVPHIARLKQPRFLLPAVRITAEYDALVNDHLQLDQCLLHITSSLRSRHRELH